MQKAGKLVTALVIYLGFSIYLFCSYADQFRISQHLFIVNPAFAALGCFILSRRWVVSFVGSFFSGLVYGFGPFVLFLGRFHPAAGSIAAIVPWLFLPFAFIANKKPVVFKLLFILLPFVFITGLFFLMDFLGIYPVPTQLRFELSEIYCLLAPVALVNKVEVLAGFYHVPIAPLIIGGAMLFKAKRYSTLIIFLIGLILSFLTIIPFISAVMWLTIPLLCCCILIGEGTDGLSRAGYNDRKWVLASVIVMLAVAITTLVMAKTSSYIIAGLGSGYTRLFIDAVRMYVFGTIAMLVIFFFAKGKSRLLWLRTLILSSAMAVDIFIGACYIVDSIFG